MALPVELEDVDRATLTPIVREATGKPALTVLDHRLVQLHGGADLSSAVYRVSGTGRSGTQHLDWSVILKIIRAAPGDEDPGWWHYWKREALIYESGILDDLDCGIVAPRCLA